MPEKCMTVIIIAGMQSDASQDALDALDCLEPAQKKLKVNRLKLHMLDVLGPCN